MLVEDAPVHELPRRTRARRIALLEQESTSTVPLTVREVVSLGRIPYRSLWGTDPDDAAVDRALVSAQADHLADRPWSSLSGGERQRVQIARALAQEPELLLLDEPTNHLDVSAQLSLLAFVRDLGTTTVAALHDLNLAAAFCEHVLVLADGHLAAAGHPREVLTPALLRQVYGVEADVLEHPRTGRPVIAFHEPTRSAMKITVLSGGVGGARFTRGLRGLAAATRRTSRSSRTPATTCGCTASASAPTSTP